MNFTLQLLLIIIIIIIIIKGKGMDRALQTEASLQGAYVLAMYGCSHAIARDVR